MIMAICGVEDVPVSLDLWVIVELYPTDPAIQAFPNDDLLVSPIVLNIG